ncbi:hypothetical protein JMJ77_0004699 [Colletotrichum scovillei]|uniref:Nephrocystin 3-like N-terminal domain-containing protein n=1 Tax=Colletotrichum scovillei TaxID=1209932 RepID=A0A9P7UHG5_9PEZI|nr:hypothetical protein JMJ77_0004699 [Colletotrichum scovillei]KAG7075908.1 hypothetical protein JMJ76_0013182 [Colletotrichum scovillei]KAG7083021.1 hypothetical protein JMJ78_0008472 [Colletotrichum scovillei]
MVGDTPLSVVCAKHVDTIRQDMDSSKLVHVLSLVFFCSRQRDNHRENTGTSMIRSFIAQLIRLHKELNLGILSLEKQSSAGQAIIRERKVEDLCLEFRNLVKAFGPTTTIVCFIEGLGFCRERNYWAEVNTVISCLDELSLGLTHSVFANRSGQYFLNTKVWFRDIRFQQHTRLFDQC